MFFCFNNKSVKISFIINPEHVDKQDNLLFGKTFQTLALDWPKSSPRPRKFLGFDRINKHYRIRTTMIGP